MRKVVIAPSWSSAPPRARPVRAYRRPEVTVPQAFRERLDSSGERSGPADSTRAMRADSAGAAAGRLCRRRGSRLRSCRRPAGRGARDEGLAHGVLARSRRLDARPADRRAGPRQSRRAAPRSRGCGAPGGTVRGGARPGADRDGRRRVHPAADLGRDVSDRLGARSPTRTSGTAASTRRGSSISSGGSARRCRRRARLWTWPVRTCGTCRCRSPRSWRAPTSSCGVRRSSSRSPSGTRRTSGGRWR